MSSNSEENDFVPSILYDQITRRMPIASVEAVIVMEGSLLFLKRKNQPPWGSGGLLGQDTKRRIS